MVIVNESAVARKLNRSQNIGKFRGRMQTLLFKPRYLVNAKKYFPHRQYKWEVCTAISRLAPQWFYCWGWFQGGTQCPLLCTKRQVGNGDHAGWSSGSCYRDMHHFFGVSAVDCMVFLQTLQDCMGNTLHNSCNSVLLCFHLFTAYLISQQNESLL